MDETPELSGPHHPVAKVAVAPATRPLDQVLDGLSLLVLGWAAVLWHLGSNAVRAGAAALAGLRDLPGFSDLSGVAGPGVDRSLMSLGLGLLAVPFVLAVLVTFGRRPGRVRRLAAAPLLAGLVAIGVWQFIEGTIRHPIQIGQVPTTVPNASSWDGAAASLALAAVLLAVVRQYRLTRQLQVFATIAVLLSVVATAAEPVLYFRGIDLSRLREGGGYLWLLLDLFAPELVLGLIGLLMAPLWLYLLGRGYLRGAAAVVMWGAVVAAGLLWPAELGTRSLAGGAPISGLDWPQGLLAAAAAVLIAPVVTAYRQLDRSGRALLLGAPLAVLALLLIAHLGGLLAGFRILDWASSIPLPVPQALEQSTAYAALLGAVLVLGLALGPRAAGAPVVMLVAAVLITVPTALFLVPEALGEQPGPDSLRNFPSLVLPMLSWWDGGEIALSFVLPGVLFALMAVNRWWGGNAPARIERDERVESVEPVVPGG